MSRMSTFADPSDNPPDWCFEASEGGALPTCTYANGTWHRSYEDDGLGGSGDGVPGFFVAFVLLVVVLGVGTTIWRVTTAQRMARDSGMSESDATAMALLTDDGLEATYLASNLRPPVAPRAPEPAAASVSAADRLLQLRQLVDQELITMEEYETRRRAIIDSV